jgi:cytidylate kinase
VGIRITLTGTPGSGKSTLREYVCSEYGLDYMYMGQIFRDLAKKRGMTITEYLELGEKDPSIDREPDEYQREWGAKNSDYVLEGRTSFVMVPESIKVLVTVDPEVGAKRIFQALQDDPETRNEGRYGSWEEVLTDNRRRMATDTKRYREHYGVDAFDPVNFDIVIDTTGKTKEEARKEFAQKLEDILE